MPIRVVPLMEAAAGMAKSSIRSVIRRLAARVAVVLVVPARIPQVVLVAAVAEWTRTAHPGRGSWTGPRKGEMRVARPRWWRQASAMVAAAAVRARAVAMAPPGW